MGILRPVLDGLVASVHTDKKGVVKQDGAAKRVGQVCPDLGKGAGAAVGGVLVVAQGQHIVVGFLVVFQHLQPPVDLIPGIGFSVQQLDEVIFHGVAIVGGVEAVPFHTGYRERGYQFHQIHIPLFHRLQAAWKNQNADGLVILYQSFDDVGMGEIVIRHHHGGLFRFHVDVDAAHVAILSHDVPP